MTISLKRFSSNLLLTLRSAAKQRVSKGEARALNSSFETPGCALASFAGLLRMRPCFVARFKRTPECR
jgi:hypothetical protein